MQYCRSKIMCIFLMENLCLCHNINTKMTQQKFICRVVLTMENCLHTWFIFKFRNHLNHSKMLAHHKVPFDFLKYMLYMCLCVCVSDPTLYLWIRKFPFYTNLLITEILKAIFLSSAILKLLYSIILHLLSLSIIELMP